MGEAPQSTSTEAEEESIIDTSQMNDGQRAAMEVAESARDTQSEKSSFGRDLFMGQFRPELLYPFPQQSRDDEVVGDRLISEVSDYLKENLDPEQVDEQRTVPQEVIDTMAKMGLFALKVPKEYGGLGLSQVNYNRLMAAVASYCGSTAVLLSAHQSIGVPQPLKLFGTEEQKRRYLPRFKEGAISAFALTEVDVGSDPAQMSTEALLSEDGKFYILNGEKLYTTNGPIADILVVMAKTRPKMVRGQEIPQITAFIVEANTPGVEVRHRCDFMGIRGIQNGLMGFVDVKVPVENVLVGEGKGLKLALATLNTGRLTLPAACAGMARQCLQVVRRWGNKREQWGLPVGFHEAGRAKISLIARSTLAIEAVTWLSSHWADRGDLDIRIEAAMAKLFTTERCWEVIDTTLQFRGGRGYEKAASLKARGEEHWPIERMMRESRINTIIEGTSDVMKLFLAREAMDPHLKLAADLLKKSAGVGTKGQALWGCVKFYSSWYPKQWFSARFLASDHNIDGLAEHFAYVDKTSHKLARSIFHQMAKYRDRLEKKQNLLGRLMEIGTELWVMAATCSYALHLKASQPNVIEIAEDWCVHSRLKIERLFEDLGRSSDVMDNALASRVLGGDYKWMEKGVIPLVDEPFEKK